MQRAPPTLTPKSMSPVPSLSLGRPQFIKALSLPRRLPRPPRRHHYLTFYPTFLFVRRRSQQPSMQGKTIWNSCPPSSCHTSHYPQIHLSNTPHIYYALTQRRLRRLRLPNLNRSLLSKRNGQNRSPNRSRSRKTLRGRFQTRSGRFVQVCLLRVVRIILYRASDTTR